MILFTRVCCVAISVLLVFTSHGFGQDCPEGEFATVNDFDTLLALQECKDIPRADLDQNGTVEFADFLLSMYSYGQLGVEQGYEQGDTNLDGNIDLADFAVLSYHFGTSGFQADPAPSPAMGLELVGTNNGALVIRGSETRVGGFELHSSDHQLIPLPNREAAPFAFLLSNTSSLIGYGSLASSVVIDGDLTLTARLNAGSNQLQLRWFESQSVQVHTVEAMIVSDATLPDCNGDGVVDASDLDCTCSSEFGINGVLSTLNARLGDLDLDGRVDFPDFVRLSVNFGKNDADYREGDLDCDGQVHFADFLIFSQSFGQQSDVRTSVGNVASAASVPEPQGLLLIMIGSLCTLSRTRLRRKISPRK